MKYHQSEEVRFRLEIPGNALTFREFTKGSQLELRDRANSYKPRAYIKFLFIWIALTFVFFMGVAKINLSLGIWSKSTGELLITLYDSGIFFSLIILFFVGMVFGVVLIGRPLRKSARRIYEQSESCQNGYILELIDSGIYWSSNSSYGFMNWKKVKAVVSDKNVDYIYMGGIYLWIPHQIPETVRQPAIAFIQEHCRLIEAEN